MIFIVTEQIMNGTVTMDVMAYGIEENSFGEAKRYLRRVVATKGGEITHADNDRIDYSISQKSDFTLYGSMKKQPLKILTDPSTTLNTVQ